MIEIGVMDTDFYSHIIASIKRYLLLKVISKIAVIFLGLIRSLAGFKISQVTPACLANFTVSFKHCQSSISEEKQSACNKSE